GDGDGAGELAVLVAQFQGHWQDLLYRRAEVAAGAEGAPPAEENQTAAEVLGPARHGVDAAHAEAGGGDVVEDQGLRPGEVGEVDGSLAAEGDLEAGGLQGPRDVPRRPVAGHDQDALGTDQADRPAGAVVERLAVVLAADALGEDGLDPAEDEARAEVAH